MGIRKFLRSMISRSKSYDLAETDTELFITEHVNNLLFRKSGPMEGMSDEG